MKDQKDDLKVDGLTIPYTLYPCAEASAVFYIDFRKYILDALKELNTDIRLLVHEVHKSADTHYGLRALILGRGGSNGGRGYRGEALALRCGGSSGGRRHGLAWFLVSQ